jgi:hypothetical protein
VIYNLQAVSGFDSCIARMRDGDIEGTAAELDLGRMLFLNRVPFRYVVPQGIKGKRTTTRRFFFLTAWWLAPMRNAHWRTPS